MTPSWYKHTAREVIAAYDKRTSNATQVQVRATRVHLDVRAPASASSARLRTALDGWLAQSQLSPLCRYASAVRLAAHVGTDAVSSYRDALVDTLCDAVNMHDLQRAATKHMDDPARVLKMLEFESPWYASGVVNYPNAHNAYLTLLNVLYHLPHGRSFVYDPRVQKHYNRTVFGHLFVRFRNCDMYSKCVRVTSERYFMDQPIGNVTTLLKLLFETVVPSPLLIDETYPVAQRLRAKMTHQHHGFIPPFLYLRKVDDTVTHNYGFTLQTMFVSRASGASFRDTAFRRVHGDRPQQTMGYLPCENVRIHLQFDFSRNNGIYAFPTYYVAVTPSQFEIPIQWPSTFRTSGDDNECITLRLRALVVWVSDAEPWVLMMSYPCLAQTYLYDMAGKNLPTEAEPDIWTIPYYTRLAVYERTD